MGFGRSWAKVEGLRTYPAMLFVVVVVLTLTL